MSIQGKSNGGQAAAMFEAYNAKAGSAVVDMTRCYNTGNKYSSQISNGNQIDLAFAEINADASGNPFPATNNIPDYGNGTQMSDKFAALQVIIDAP